MRQATVRLWQAALVGAVLAVVVALGVLLPKCEGSGPHPFTGPAAVTTAARTAAAQCTKAYGDCQVTEYVHVRADGTHWVETCFEAAPVSEGHGGVLVAVDYCYRPRPGWPTGRASTLNLSGDCACARGLHGTHPGLTGIRGSLRGRLTWPISSVPTGTMP